MHGPAREGNGLLSGSYAEPTQSTFAIEPSGAEYGFNTKLFSGEKGLGELSGRTKGKITSWNDDKGYGFITPLSGGKKIFIHVSALSKQGRRPQLNEVVTYSVSKDKRGRPRAADATLAGDKLTKKAPKKSNRTAISFAVLFLVAIKDMIENPAKILLEI